MAMCLDSNPWFACLLDSQAFVSVASVILGFILGVAGTRLQAFFEHRSERRSLASVLLVEIISQAHWCQERGNSWNLFAEADSMPLRLLRRDRPPKPDAYMAIADKLGLLAPTVVSRVVAFHGAVAIIRSRIDAWSGEGDNYNLVRDDRKEIAAKWRAACFNGLLAIKALEPLARTPRLPNDEAIVSRLKSDLEKVAAGELLVSTASERKQ